MIDKYPVVYPEKIRQKGFPILVITKRVYAAWASDQFPDMEIGLHRYMFHEEMLNTYVKYMKSRNFVPDWTYLYKNFSKEELSIFEKMWLKHEKEKYVLLTRQQARYGPSLDVKYWREELKKCPYCGSKNGTHSSEETGGHDACVDCGGI